MNHPNRSKTFTAKPAPRTPGDDRLILTRPWQGLSAGTYVRPLSAGMGQFRGEIINTRTITVLSGNSAGQQITGPY